MLKVIIADDEKFQREGLIMHIPWKDFSMEVAGSAEDGEEALEMIKIHNPDILITDVKMPIMDGLELSRKVRAILPKTKIIIISGYEEFEYARTAIEVNAYTYILKPVNMGKMKQILAEIASLFECERQAEEEIAGMRKQLNESKPLLLERFIKDLVFGFLKDEEVIKRRAEYLSLLLPENGYYVAVIQIEDQDVQSPEETMQWFYLNFLKFINEMFNFHSKCFYFQSKDNEYVLILSKENMDGEEVSSFIDGIKQKISDKFNIIISLGIGRLKYSMLEIHEGYTEAEIAARQKFYLGKGKSIFFSDINPQESIPISYKGIYEDLLTNLEIGNNVEAVKALDAISELFSKSSMVQQQYIKAFCFRLMSDTYRILYEMNENIENIFGEEDIIWDKIYRFDTIPDVGQWLKNIVNTVAEYIFNKRSRKNSHIVDMIIKIIRERYNEQITIDEIAKKVFLTSSYICNLFKESKGESIIEYLTKVRLKHAQKLLADPSLKIYEIAEQSGFNSTSYFSIVFKNAFGMNPKDYRTLLSGNG